MTDALTLEADSLEYVRLPVSADGLDLSADPVELAFTDMRSNPQSGDWQAAVWDEGAARILVGPGGDITLASGIWRIWVRVMDNPEVPVLRAGTLTVR